MLWHGITPDNILKSTMIPIPKGRWANLSDSNNFRAITLSSMIGKVLELVIMNREMNQLCTRELQFGFKEGLSTTMCTYMVQETVSYFVHEKSNVYGLLLDASKAFDRVNYVFKKKNRIMLEKGVCPLICNLLLDMYVNQRIRLRWNDVYSDFFTVSNGVKQGGILSPCLFSVYIDGMLNALQEENIGCFMGTPAHKATRMLGH